MFLIIIIDIYLFLGTSNNTEENDATPSHWAPYAESDRESHDAYRR